MTAGERNAGELWRRFERTASAHPYRLAVASPDETLTFADVSAIAEQMSVAFSECGVRAGAVVHVALPNVPAFVPAVLALSRLAAIIGLVPSKYRESEFRALHQRAPPRAYLTTAGLAGAIERAVPGCARRAITTPGYPTDCEWVFSARGDAAVGAMESEAIGSMPKPEGLEVIMFTSGSSGVPKGVARTVGNMVSEAGNVVETLGIDSTDRILVPVSISHAYGFNLGLLPMAFAGAAMVIHRSFVPARILGELAAKQTTVCLGVPSMYRILADFEQSRAVDLSHVRYLLSSTASLSVNLITDFHKRFNAPICQEYGTSETGAITVHVPSGVLERPSSVGVAVKNVEIRVVGSDGRPLGSGQEGEVVVRSGSVSAGYVTDPAGETSQVFSSVGKGMFEYRTGDLGVIDGEGFLFVRGRKDDVINVGGMKVYPSEVAQILGACPGVDEAHVLGIEDTTGEEVVHAYVTLSHPVGERDILAFCRAHLADYKVPRRIDIVDTIPIGEVAKMRKLSEDRH